MSKAITDVLKLLGDDNRLRLLNLLEEEELSVRELVSITGLGQSRVSHHLGLLRNAGVIADRREGTWTYYRLVPLSDRTLLPRDLWRAVGRPFASSEQAGVDHDGLERIRAERRRHSQRAHDALAGVWRLVGENLERGSLRSEALAALAAPELVVADLGCGAGFFTKYLAARVGRVIAVDHSRAMLDETRAALPADAAVELRHGELDELPLDDGEVDAVVSNMVLHHLADFEPVVAEVQRVLRPGGVAVVSDLRPHSEEWMREELGDLRLGIDPDELASALAAGGFESVEQIPVEDRYRMRSRGGRAVHLELFLIRARKGSGRKEKRT